MKLEFGTVRLKNFKTWIGEHVLSFTELGVGLHYIKGDNQYQKSLESNGSGKSTLWDAWLWCITGKTVKGLRNPNVIPWSGETPTTVKFTFKINNRPRSITRGINPNFTHIDDRDCDQNEIEKLLQLNWDVILFTILLGQGKDLFFDLTAGKKLELFSTVLNLDRWDTRAEKVSDEVDALEKDRRAVNQDMIVVTSQIESADALIAGIRDRIASWDDDVRIKVENIESNITAKKAERERLTKLKTDADLAADGAGVELKALREYETKLRDKIQTARDVYNQANTKIEVMWADKKRLQTEISNLADLDDCPTCGQSLDGLNLKKHADDIRKKIAALDRKIDQDLPSETSINLLKHDLIRTNEHMHKFTTQVETARSSLNRLVPQIANIDGVITSLQTQIYEVNNQPNPYRTQLKEAEKKRGVDISKQRDLKKELDAISADIINTKFWIKGFKDIRLLIVDDVLRELEMATNSMLPDAGLDGWEVKYTIEKETKSGTITRGLTVTIYSPTNKDPVPWEVWSGGEGQRLRIVGSLALGQVLLDHAGVQTNVEILDEPSRGMTAGGVSDLCAYLSSRAEQLNKIIFLVDHQTVESAYFTSEITVTKTAKGSSLTIN